MPTAAVKAERNQSMELCKFIASLFVIFIHVPFPGEFGKQMDCLARFAVPIFFMISGYFNYGVSRKQIVKRTARTVKLLIIGVLLCVFSECICVELDGGSTISHFRQMIPEQSQVVKWIILHTMPDVIPMGHLWYLTSMIVCYLIYYCYIVFTGEEKCDYRPFYTMCLSAFMLFFAFGILAPANGDREIARLFRNGWFFAVPMFGLGLFFRQYQERIFVNFKLTTGKLIVVILLGILLSMMQCRYLKYKEMPFGTLFEVIALMLLLISHPKLVCDSGISPKIILKLGAASMWMYLLHLPLERVYETRKDFFVDKLGAAEPWLKPLMLAGVTLLMAIFCTIVEQRLHKLPKGREKRS